MIKVVLIAISVFFLVPTERAEARHFNSIDSNFRVYYSSFETGDRIVGESRGLIRIASDDAFPHVRVGQGRFDADKGDLRLSGREVSQITLTMGPQALRDWMMALLNPADAYAAKTEALLHRYLDGKAAKPVEIQINYSDDYSTRIQLHDDLSEESVHLEVQIDPKSVVTH